MRSTPSDEIMLKTEGLTKRYAEFTALSDLNLSIPRGSVFGYIGHNGAGKTTTIRILAGLLQSTSGKAIIGGVDVTGDRDHLKRLVGYMPDDFGVYDQMRVWEYLDFFGSAFKIPRSARKKRLDEVMAITGSEALRDKFVDTLSKGMKQRVGIARTLMHDPQVLLLDEPANGLDPRARIDMRNLIRQLADDGKTILVSSHILPELAEICDLVGIIHQGVLQTAGPIDKVLSSIKRDRLVEAKALGEVSRIVQIIQKEADCRKLDLTEQKVGVVQFRFAGNDAAMSALLAKLVPAGLVTFREVPLSLEDAFMALSGMSAPEQTDEETETDQAGHTTSAPAAGSPKSSSPRKVK